MMAAFYKHRDPNGKILAALVFATLLSLGLTHTAHASPILETAQYSSMDIPTIKAQKIAGCFVTPTPQMAARGERFFKEGC